MEIELREITIADLVDGYNDSGDEGVVGYGGRLDIRPRYQREFVYEGAQRDAVIDTVSKGYPLNVMYWAVRADGNFEVLDGQQRTLSICRFVKGKFSCKNLFGMERPRGFHNLQDDEQAKVLGYPLMVYQCTGSESEKLEWFKTVNIAGLELTNQELRNAVYAGSWVSDAKRYFSKTNYGAHGLGGDYVKGRPNRQELLEIGISWLAGGGENIDAYMGEHQHDQSAEPLWEHFRAVIEWVQAVFPKYRREMKGLDWGGFYARYKSAQLNAEELEARIVALMQDDDVTKKSGVYAYLLTDEERHLNIRAFTQSQKRAAYERQRGKCKTCQKEFHLGEMEADHIRPWHENGKTIPENCQMLCRDCNRQKGGK